MPRPERPLDPSAGPLQAFAAELRALREEHGSPKYLQMARRSGRSRTALTEAAGGDHLPTWETVEAYVTALDADPAPWRIRHEQVQALLREDRAATPADPEPAAPAEAESPAEPGGLASSRRRWRSPRPLTGGTAIVLLAGGVAAVVYVLRSGGDPRPTSTGAVRAVVITVQNKIAIGRSSLVEDSTPVYLSREPVAFCSRRGCEIGGTALWSGALVVATCQVRGEQMTNADLGSKGIDRNSGRVSSSLWYRVTLQPGGVTGYLSEVYVAPPYRHGHGLPTCR